MVEDQTHIDTTTPNINSKFFHNKLSVGMYQITIAAQRVLDPRTLLGFLGPIGLFFAASSLFQVSKTKIKANLLFLVVAMILVLFTKFTFSILVLMAAWQMLALQGISFLKNSTLQKISLVLLVLTFWYFSIDWKMPQICNEIFFN